MKNFIMSLTARQKKWAVPALIGVFLFFAGTIFINITVEKLYDQTGASRWSEEGDFAQLTCFMPVGEMPDDYYFLNITHTIEEKYKEQSMETPAEGRLFVDAYSVEGNINLSTEHGSITLHTIGVTDDFFLFHPISMIGGAYFNNDMVMKDGILIDEDAAWQLYGSNDVVGMPVYVGEIPLYIRGVVDRAEGHLEEAAGLEGSVGYVSLETLSAYGEIQSGYTYEAIMPNPVEEFAKNIFAEAIGDTEGNYIIVENSERFTGRNLWKIAKEFGLRSMTRKNIVFPYWENVARGYEDYLSVIYVIKTAGLIMALILIGLFIRGKWKVKTWTVKSVGIKGIRRMKELWKNYSKEQEEQSL